MIWMAKSFSPSRVTESYLTSQQAGMVWFNHAFL